MDGGASGHLRQDVEFATVAMYAKSAFLFLLANVIVKAILSIYLDKFAF